MNSQIIGSHEGLSRWLQTPAGIYLQEWETVQFDRAVSDIFGYHGLQVGTPEILSLRNSRISHCWVAQTHLGTPSPPSKVDIYFDSVALPFADQSLDLVVLPHALELSSDPHATLREVERVLVPEGRVVISGFNPLSLWGQRQRRAHAYARLGWHRFFLPREVDFIGYWRLRDWLRLLSFEVAGGRFGCYRPAVESPTWLSRFAWMDKAGDRWWPILGAVYFLVAIKRVRGMRLMGPVWKRAKSRSVAAIPTVNSGRSTTNGMHSVGDDA